MFSLCSIAKAYNKWEYTLIAILIYSIVFGMRYGVGVDFYGYLDAYKSALIGNSTRDFEIGFQFIIKVLTYIGLHSIFFFGFISFLQLYLIFKSIKTDIHIYKYLVFTFMMGCVWLGYANTIRQVLAFCIFVYSLTYIEKGKPFLHYLCILLATSVHTSAIGLIVIYPLLYWKKEWFNNINIQIALFICAWFLGQSSELLGIKYISEILSNNGLFEDNYSIYISDEYQSYMHNSVKLGIGYLTILLTDIILVTTSNKYKQALKNNLLTYMYNLYFIGILLRYTFISSMMVGRINDYFYGFKYIIASYALYYLYSHNNKKLFYLLASMYIMTFIANMVNMFENTAVFRFFWEKQYLLNI